MAVSKRTGRKSVVANDFLIPLPPGPPEAFDVGTNRPFDNGSAVVNFSTAVTSPATVSYKVYANATGQTEVTATGTTSPIIITGLKSNILYTFTVTGFTEAGNESPPSDPSTPTLITTVPATPAAPTATSPNANQDVVNWLAPATGGKTITGYIWAASDGKTNATGGNPGGGPTTNLSVTVNQEPGTNQTYTVYAINANGDSLLSLPSNTITTTFSFAPFGFVPFMAFSFVPFMAFSFTPFMAFMFTPFMAFMFTPFNAFGFTPRFFGFAPRPMCIGAKTPITVVDEDGNTVFVAAEDLKVGDKVVSPVWKEFDSGEFIDHEHEKVSYKSMMIRDPKIVSVEKIESKTVTETIIFNNDSKKHFSTVQPILAKKQYENIYSWEITKDIAVGDTIMEFNPDTQRFTPKLVTNVELITNKEETVYRITPENFLTFVAGDVICC
jgi:hypothetical protein